MEGNLERKKEKKERKKKRKKKVERRRGLERKLERKIDERKNKRKTERWEIERKKESGRGRDIYAYTQYEVRKKNIQINIGKKRKKLTHFIRYCIKFNPIIYFKIYSTACH